MGCVRTSYTVKFKLEAVKYAEGNGEREVGRKYDDAKNDHPAVAVGVSLGTSYKILFDDLKMTRVTQHSVPGMLSQDRDDHMVVCSDLISSADGEPTFLNQIITGDEI
ncbi:hypothetical protein C0J52_04321 [Blattella germanica]|nr:hypothetical protein C0J52_04321 [Blattella germanica]